MVRIIVYQIARANFLRYSSLCGRLVFAPSSHKRDLLKRLLDAGIRVPRLVTGCQSYILEQPDMLKTLLDNGMYPDTWLNFLHPAVGHILAQAGAGGALASK